MALRWPDAAAAARAAAADEAAFLAAWARADVQLLDAATVLLAMGGTVITLDSPHYIK
jgi:hypothetical protein